MPITEQILDQSVPAHVRRNHALEHATLHVLREKGVSVPMGGISDAGGFWIYGDIDTESLLDAASEALHRLEDGESDLAVHPNCGTNIAVGAVSGGALAWLSMLGAGNNPGKKLRRMPVAILMGLVGYQLAQPLGPKVQEQITTDANVKSLHIVDVIRHDWMGYKIHRVSTRMTA